MPHPLRPASVPQPPWRLTGLIGLTGLLCTMPATAQTLDQLRDEVRRAASESRYAANLTALSDLATDGELSGGSLRIEGAPAVRMRLLSVPWRKDVGIGDDLPSLRVELTAGYASSQLRMADLWSGALPGQETRISSLYQSFAVDAGAGPSFPLGPDLRVEPMLHGGLSYVENRTNYRGPGAGLTRALADGILFNWDGVYGTVGGSLALRGTGWQLGEVEVRPLLRYDLRRSEGIHVDDPALDGNDTLQWATARLDLSGPIGWHPAGRELRWLADIGYRRFLANSDTVLGFRDYFEFGAGLVWNVEGLMPLLSALQLGGAILVGEDVLGWTLGVSVRL